jgi:hypothetical protein
MRRMSDILHHVDFVRVFLVLEERDSHTPIGTPPPSGSLTDRILGGLKWPMSSETPPFRPERARG